MTAEPARRTFTVAEYYQMSAAGIFSEDDRVELIEGDVIQLPPVGSPHASGVKRYTHFLGGRVGDSAVVSVQDPLRLSDQSEPLPDFMLLRPRADFYAGDHPTPSDVLLLVEVSDSSLAYDRRVKLPLYAREGIPEVWLTELSPQVITVHRDPTPDGYRITYIHHRGDHVSPAVFPNLILAVDDLLGPPPDALSE